VFADDGEDSSALSFIDNKQDRMAEKEKMNKQKYAIKMKMEN
jgi:hypothetical protein